MQEHRPPNGKIAPAQHGRTCREALLLNERFERAIVSRVYQDHSGRCVQTAIFKKLPILFQEVFRHKNVIVEENENF